MKDVKTLLLMKKQIGEILTQKQKRQCIYIMIVIFIGSLFELLGVSAILPFIESILNTSQLRNKWYFQIIATYVQFQSDINMIIFFGIIIILIYIIKNLFLLFSNFVQSKFKLRLQKNLSVLMLSSYMRRSYSFFVNTNSSEMLRGINEDVYGVYAILEYFFKIMMEGLTVAVIAIFLVITDPTMALGIILVAAICFSAITFGLKKKMAFLGKRQRAVLAKQNQYAYQAINGIKEIAVMRRNEAFIKKYADAYEIKRKTDVAYYFAQSLPERLIETSCIGGIIGMVCLRLYMGVDVNSFVPQLATFAIAAFRILPAISRMTGYVSGMVFYRPTLEAAYENISEARSYEKNVLNYVKNNRTEKLQTDIRFHKELDIQEISWKYDGQKKNVLSELNMKIRKGEAIGLIGESGAGKTTLADVILGLFQPQTGKIYMDGIDIFTIRDEWAKIVGYVPQDIYLLDATIRDNILFGLENSGRDDKVWEVLRMAQLDEFVRKLPQKLDTMVGERGTKFSGGQRQRMAIARALYCNPDILILDEATSALDNETEKAVMESIDFLQGQITLIIVAHRLSTIRNCDKIYEIVNGKAIMKRKDEVFEI